jgi:hypothetical protein
MIRTALLDPKGQRPFPDALLAGGVEVPETGAATPVPRDANPNEAAPEQVPADAAMRPVMRRAMYPK